MKKVVILSVMLLASVSVMAHPLKMAYTSVKYNPARQVFEISHRVFQDDFENTLRSAYGYKGGDVYTQQKTAVTQKAVNTFFEQNFSISFNNIKPKLQYIKTEQKNQMGIIVWYETGKIPAGSISTITVYNHILMESFKEQVNMFNLNINDDVKRTLKFELGKTKETINIRS